MPATSNASLLRGTFSSSLRSRFLWQALEPILTATESYFQEASSQGHDFTFHLTPNGRSLRIILLSPSSLCTLNKQETITRLERFSPCITSDPPKNAVAFLLSEGSFTKASEKHSVEGLMALQVMMVECLPAPISVIPILNPSNFLSGIQDYMSSIVDIPVLQPTAPDSMSLLSRAVRSSYSQLSEQDVNLLSELAPSLGVLSRGVRTTHGWELLVDHFGELVASEIAGFWEDDEQ